MFQKGMTDKTLFAAFISSLTHKDHFGILILLVKQCPIVDRLLQALNQLEIGNADSVRRFKRNTRLAKEKFLRFTHRYWFNAASDEPLCQGSEKPLPQATRQRRLTQRFAQR